MYQFLAIDPGPRQSAYVIWDRDQDKMISCMQAENDFILSSLEARWEEFPWNQTVIEGVYFYGKILNKETFSTLEWIGRFTQRSMDHWTEEVYKVFFPDVAMHFCNSRSKIKQANINAVLDDRYGGKGTAKAPGVLFGVKEHIWSAVHVAAYWTDNHSKFEIKDIWNGES